MRILSLLPRFRQARRRMRALEARESWSREDIEKFQLDRLNSVWSHAIFCVPYYRELRASANLPERFRDLAEFRASVPVLPRSEVRDRPLRFLSNQASAGEWHRTSGSTGTPVGVFWANEASHEVVRGRYRHQAAWGVDMFDRQAFLWGDGGASAKPRWLDRWAAWCRLWGEDMARNRIRLSPRCVGREDLHIYLRKLERFRPSALYAYSSAAYLLALEARAVGFCCPSLRVSVLSAEPTPAPLVRAVEQGLGVPAVREYGSVECGPIAFEGPDRVLRVREDSVLVETPPRAEGRWDVVVTTLHNPSFPLFRYAIGDITDGPLAAPARGFAALPNVTGRDNDMIRTRSGRMLNPNWIDFLFEQAHGVRRYTIRQHRDGGLSVQIEPTDYASPPDAAWIQREIQRLVEGYPVSIDFVHFIHQTNLGKHRWITSELQTLAVNGVQHG